MRPGGQRVKGATFERLIANDLKAIFPGARRGFQSRGGGAEQCDVEGTPYHIECKHGARVDVAAALRQAEEDSHGARCAVVVWRNNRGPIQVTMRAFNLAALIYESDLFDAERGRTEQESDVDRVPCTIPYAYWLTLLRRSHG